MASTPLDDRRVRIAVDDLLITDLRVQFKIKKTLKKEPNTAEISISNLNQNHRAQLQSKKPKIIVEAGYAGNLAQIFSGNSRYVDQIKDGADWVTKVQCGDGELAYKYRRVAAAFAPGTAVSDVASSIAKGLGLTVVGGDHLKTISEQFLQGYSAFGKAATELDRLLAGRGLEWSIQDGQLQILPVDGTTKDSVVLLSPGTGLVGSPEHGNPEKQVPLTPDQYVVLGHKKKGPAILKVKSLLQPLLRPGRRVQVQARGIKGLFRIQTVTHTGDTHGGDWYSELECLPTA